MKCHSQSAFGSTLIGCPATAGTAKIGFDPIWNGKAIAAGTAAAAVTAQRNSYGANGILTEFSLRQRQNGNGSMATEGWKPAITYWIWSGGGDVTLRHN